MSLKLKMLRKQANMTLEELARSADLTRSYISKIERGMSIPSIGVALRLAKALGVPVEALFDTEPAQSPLVITRAKAPRSEAQIQGTPRMIAGATPGHQMIAFILEPGDESAKAHRPTNHDGEEILFVLSGSIVLELAGKRETLAKGDCAHFAASIPHRIMTAGHKPAQVLLVVAPAAA